MKSYLSQLVEASEFTGLSALKPDDLCPYLYYILSPYLYVLANDGWFPWVRQTPDPGERRPPKVNRPFQKNVNRRYINEVVVRCPNPDRVVLAGVGPGEDDNLAVRILRGDPACPSGHRTGREFSLTREAGRQSMIYSRLFPEILIKAITDLDLEEAMTLFDGAQKGAIRTAVIHHPCRYHRQSTAYAWQRLLPGGADPHLFQQAYPHVLAVMYDAKVEPRLTVHRPGGDEKMMLEIEKKPLGQNVWMERAQAAFDRLCAGLGRPREPLNYRLDIRASIPVGQTGGSAGPALVWPVNPRAPGYPCPAGLHAIYPYLLLAAAGRCLDWGNPAAIGLAPCPDCAGVIYAISRHSER